MTKPTATMPALIRAAVWWNKHGVKGRGAITRMIGRRWSGQEFFVTTKNKALLSVDAPNLDMYASIFNGGGVWEPHVMQTCARVLRTGDVYFDIGSNTGLFALDAAVSVPGLTVYAFEPQPTLASHIRRSIEANRLADVACLELLLGQEEGEKTLYLTSHSIHASLSPRETHYRELRLPMRTIDGLVQSGDVKPPDIIKIDIEGAELMVFEGAQKVLAARAPTVVFEADENMMRLGVKTSDLFQSLARAAPYAFFLIKPDGTLTPAAEPYAFGNYIALSPRHSDRL